MASKEAEAAKEMMRAFRDAVVGGTEPPTLEQQRAGMAMMAESASVPDGVTVTETYAGGCRAYWNDPVGCAMDRVILYVHGGGYVIGSPKIA